MIVMGRFVLRLRGCDLMRGRWMRIWMRMRRGSQIGLWWDDVL